MENTAYKVIFFDIGGILLSDGWGHLSRQKAALEFGLDYTEMEELHQLVASIFELGKITLDEYLDVVVFNRSRAFSKGAFKAFIFAQSVALPNMLPWLKTWKENTAYRIFALNNESREINDYRIEKFALHHCFDAFISSCDVGFRKPDPDIFRLAINVAHALPEECLYFDDRSHWVAAAKKLRIKAMQHQDFATTKAVLEAL